MGQTHQPPVSSPRRAPVREFFAHLIEMPRWHKVVLTIAGGLAACGLLGQASGMVAGSSPAVMRSDAPKDAPVGGSHAFDTRSTPTSPEPSAEPQTPSMAVRVSPWATRVGLGFVGGFVIGWAFRAFIKLMATITIAGVAILAALSYFNVFNIDTDAAQSKLKSSTGWVSDQATRAKDAAMAHLPGSFASFAGMFVGFRRK
jgi:uncharacterized membrane protein (Fun14 family)